MTLVSSAEVPFLTTCDLCHARMATLPGPRNRQGRPLPPAGYRTGYVVEFEDRSFPICSPCLTKTIGVSA